MNKTKNNNTEQKIGMALFLATIWFIIAGYLISLPVDANNNQLTDINKW
jgi:hypothetical protein